MKINKRFVWEKHHVVDADNAAAAARTYREHKDVRDLLTRALGGRQLTTACEVGAGYGRMTILLTEFADRVVGLEREPHLADEAARLYPDVGFERVETLSALPLADNEVDLVLTFTVLQHQLDDAVVATASEILRVLRPDGALLLCEETDPEQQDIETEGGVGTIGRPVAWYQDLFAPLRLIETRPRRIEPTYPRQHVGTYMLFRGQ